MSKSLIRYLVLSAPFFLNRLTLPITRTPQIVMYLLTGVIFGLGATTIYLVLFNRRTRQGVHDLAAGSYVADADKSGALVVHPIWRGHWAVLGALVVVAVIGGKVLESKLMKLADFPAMLSDARVVEDMDHVQSAGVSDLTWTPWSGAEKKTIYVVNVSVGAAKSGRRVRTPSRITNSGERSARGGSRSTADRNHPGLRSRYRSRSTKRSI